MFKYYLRSFSTHCKLNQKSHYDALGVSSKATQADIKSAYYKLSMLYHPDKNKNSDEAATKFRDISEAYEVLGNVKSRKLYDRGLLIHKTGVDSAPVNRFYQARETHPPAYGRSTVYDFDEWSRSHYGATFRNEQRFKEQQRAKMRREMNLAEQSKTDRAAAVIGLFFVLSAFLLFDRDYDTPKNLTFGDTVIPRRD